MKLTGSYKLNVKKQIVWKSLNDPNILKHQLNINNKPCNFVELFPRLKEK